MKLLKLFFLLFPLVAISQKRFDTTIREKLIQSNKYEYVYGFENNYAVFRTFDKKMGVIDSTETVVIKPVFTFIHNKKELTNLFEVANKVNKKFKRGFIDLKGNIKIPIIYDDVFYFGKGLIRVTQNNKYGILDTSNNIILPVKFDYTSIDNNLIVAKNKETKILYDFLGKQISNFQFTEISDFINDKAIITFQDKSNAIIDNQGNILLKPIRELSFERVLNDNLYLVKNKVNLKFGVINSKGGFIINCKYDEIIQVKAAFIAKSNDKKGFISSTDSLLKPFIYDEMYFSYFEDAVTNPGENYIVKKDTLYGVINPYKENDIIPIRYSNIRTLFDRYYKVRNNENKNGLYLQNGEKVLNEDYEFYNVYKKSIFASRNNKQYLISLVADKSFEKAMLVDEFIKQKDFVEFSNNRNQIFRSLDKFGVVNYENTIVIPCEYDYIENINASKEFIVKRNNKYGIVNTENEVKIEVEYDEFKKFKEAIMFTKMNKTIKKYHVISYR